MATLGGATVVVVPTGTVAKQYTILTATGGVPDTFNPVVSGVSSNLNPTLSYDANNVYLNFALNYGGGLNVNQQNVANALTNFFNTTGGIPAGFASLSPAGLTQVSGELATGSQQATFDAMNLFLSLMSDPFVAGRSGGLGGNTGAIPFAEESALAPMPRRSRCAARDAFAKFPTKADVARNDLFEQRWSVWGAAYRRRQQHLEATPRPGSNDATARAFGFAVGADYRLSRGTLAGFALAGGGTNFSVSRFRLRALGSVPGRRLHSPQHRQRLRHRRRGLWLAGRDDRAHGHGGGLRAPARPVQRQCVFRPHRGRLPPRDAMDGHHALCRRPVHHLQPAGLCRAGAGGRRHLCAELRGQGRHGRAHANSAFAPTSRLRCRTASLTPARPRRLGA